MNWRCRNLQETTKCTFCVHILTLPSICYPLRGHFQALEKSTVILVSLWTVAAGTWNNFIQNLHLMRTLQTFGKSGKTGENYKQVRMSLVIPNTDYFDCSFIDHSYITWYVIKYGVSFDDKSNKDAILYTLAIYIAVIKMTLHFIHRNWPLHSSYPTRHISVRRNSRFYWHL